ncbi:MAG TPA: hypothetical protein DEQ40_02480 [Oxalobacteraceae bacterium]|jgi:hypothetical protein|nr:hypothetical protein [Oxalobacteraceae bacterium]
MSADVIRAAVPFLSHYAQKYVMEKYANKPVLDDGGYEDQLFAALDSMCAAIGESTLGRAELVEASKNPDGVLLWRAE